MLRTTLAVTLCAFAFSAPAAALVKVATYTGTLYSSYDQTGEFGAANTSLDGLSYVAKYVYDTTLGVRDTQPGYDYVYGGNVYATTSPLLSATITINGITKQFASQNYYGYAYVQAGYTQHYAVDYSIDVSGQTYNYLFNQAFPAAATPSLDADVPLQSGVGGYGYFYLYSYDVNSLTRYAYGNFDYSQASTVSIGNAVPEPATWALMIAGFGLTGFAARQRRRTVAA